MQSLQEFRASKIGLWLNAHAFAEHVLCEGSPLAWSKTTEFADQYRSLQGIVEADRLSLPILGFFNDWIQRNPHILQRMKGKSRLRFALKKFLTDESMRAELTDFVGAVCAMVDADIFLELPSNSSLVSWAHMLANPGSEVATLTDVDIDSTSVYLADTVRQLKSTRLGGLVATVAEKDLDAGAEAELYRPLINVSDNYRWAYAFRLPCNATAVFKNDGHDILGKLANDVEPSVYTLSPEFWQNPVAIEGREQGFFYAELPAFAEPESVRRALSVLR